MSGLELMGQGPRRPGAPPRSTSSGLVQGVGFRPFVYVTAAELGLTGSVANTADGVVVEVEGEPGRRRRLRPPAARRRAAAGRGGPASTRPTCRSRGGTGFTIEDSADAAAAARTLASPDVATCATACASCATRPTAATGTRSSPAPTAARGSPSSPPCPTTGPPPRWPASRCARPAAREYDDPADRRFHAQPIACHDCGPTGSSWSTRPAPRSTGDDAVRAARDLLAAGPDRGGQGPRRLPPGLRRPERGGGRRAAPAQATRRQAVRGDGRRPRRRRATWPPSTDDEERLLTGRRRPIVLLARARAGADVGRRGRARQPRPRA